MTRESKTSVRMRPWWLALTLALVLLVPITMSLAQTGDAQGQSSVAGAGGAAAMAATLTWNPVLTVNKLRWYKFEFVGRDVAPMGGTAPTSQRPLPRPPTAEKPGRRAQSPKATAGWPAWNAKMSTPAGQLEGAAET
jgi:hypothetical protein